MKKLMVVTALVATSTAASAFDYKFNLEGRADFVNDTLKTTSTATTPVTTTDKWNNFSNGVIRLNTAGSFNDNLSFRFRYRFLAAAAAPTTTISSTTGRESINSGNGIDFLYVDHKNSLFTTRIGKQSWLESAGRESFVAASDLFITSAAITNFRAGNPVTPTVGIGGEYRYGVTAMFKFLDTNALSVALSNPNTYFTDTSGLATAPERKNTGLAYGVYYNGSFMNKMIQPVLGYTSASQNGDKDITAVTGAAGVGTQDVNYTMMAYGLRSEVAGATFDIDYKEFKKADKNRDGNTTAANMEQKTKSLFVNVAYTVDAFTPMFTYINDKYTTADLLTPANSNYKKDSFAIGTYYKPFADANFRYHVMYANAVTKYDNTAATTATLAAATNSKITDTKVYLGFKFDI